MKPEKSSQIESGHDSGIRARQPGTTVKRIIFSIILVALIFCSLEFILAFFGVKPLILTEDPMIGFASNVPLFVEQRNNDGTTILRTADNKQVHFNYQEFPKAKGKNSYRIFCLGGSTTYGHPYTDKVSFGRWLQAFLNFAAPDRNWEVINAGGISYASYRVANLMQELVQYEPDLFIVYSGQNEFLEERSYGSLAKLPSWVINADSALCSTRVYSFIKRLYHGLRSTSSPQSKKEFEVSGEVDDILTHSTGPTSYRRDDELRGQILQHYQLNLERMVKLARDVGAEVIFVKPAVNLKDMSPFKSEHKEGLNEQDLITWNSEYEKARALHDAGNYSEALASYNQALRIDERYAELHFMIGRALFALGRFEEAEKSFWRAVDEDIAPLRMLSSMQDILAGVARKMDVPFVDFPSVLREQYLQKYGHAVFGNEFFLDHVHTNEQGYRLLGLVLFTQLISQGVLSPGSALTPEKIAAVTAQVTSSLQDEDYRVSFIHLGLVFDWAGKFEEAKSILFKSLESFGPQAEVFELLGRIFSRQGNAMESMNYFHKALAAGYETATLHATLGNIYLETNGDYDASVNAYQNSLRMNYNDPSVHVRLGFVYVLQEKFDLARFEYDEALRLQPDFLPAQVNLMSMLMVVGRDAEALEKGYNILKDYPDDYRAHYMVGQILLLQGKRDQAVQHFQEVLRINPQFSDAEDSLREAQLHQ